MKNINTQCADDVLSLAWKYDGGDGIRKSYKKAFKLFLQAAKLGSANAMYNLNIYYQLGHGIKRDEVLAFDWAKKAAKLEYPDAVLALGWHYLNGRGTKKDTKKAEYWYLKAAEYEMVMAYFSLGQLYYDSNDYEKAMIWLNKGVKVDHKKCMYYMGRMYIEGKGVKQNYDKGIKLLIKSSSMGYYVATRLLRSKKINKLYMTNK